MRGLMNNYLDLQEKLGEVVYVALPDVSDTVSMGGKYSISNICHTQYQSAINFYSVITHFINFTYS